MANRAGIGTAIAHKARNVFMAKRKVVFLDKGVDAKTPIMGWASLVGFRLRKVAMKQELSLLNKLPLMTRIRISYYFQWLSTRIRRFVLVLSFFVWWS